LKTGLKHRKKFYFREAITAYTKGLDVQCGDSIIETVLLSNRAQVHLQLGNDRNALEDSLRAMKLDTKNVKVVLPLCCRCHCKVMLWQSSTVQGSFTVLSHGHTNADVSMQACYRAARAAYNLKQYSKALALAEQGIAEDAGASELKRIQQVASC
jgi:tetratricopeptide (TPR) repeat protein